MADSDKTLSLLIELGYIGQDQAKQARSDLDKLNQTAGESGKAADDLGEKQHEAAGHADQLHLSHRALHTLFHLIARESGPGLVVALAGVGAMAGGGAGMGIQALRYGLEWLQKTAEETKLKLEEMSEVNTAGWEASVESYGKIRELAEEFQRVMQESGRQVTQLLDQQKAKEEAVLTAKIDGEKKIRAERMESEVLAAGDNKEKIAAIRTRYQIANELGGIADEGQKIALLEKYKKANEQLSGSYGAQAHAAEKDLENFTVRAFDESANQTRIGQLKERIKEGRKGFRDDSDIFQTAEMFKSYRQMAIEHPDDKMAVAGYDSLKDRGEKADELWKQMEQYKALTQAAADHAAELKRLQEAVKTTESKFNEANRAVTSLTAQIDSAKAVMAQHQETTSRLIPIERQNAALRASQERVQMLTHTSAGQETAKGISDARAIAEKVNSGYKPNQNEDDFLRQVADAIGQKVSGQRDLHFTSAKAAATFVENSFKTNGSDQVFQMIYNAVAAGQANATAQAIAWGRKFNELERQISAGHSWSH